MTTKQDFECRDEECVDPKCPFYHPAALPKAKPTFAYSQKDEVWAMVHEHLPHGTGESTVLQLWPLLVELVERRKG